MATEKGGDVLKEQLEVLHSALNIGIEQVKRLAAEQNAKKYEELTLEEKKERLKRGLSESEEVSQFEN